MAPKERGAKMESLQRNAEKTQNKSTNSNNKNINGGAFKFCACYRLILTGDMFISQPWGLLIRSVQTCLLPPVSTSLAPELGNPQITLLGQSFLNSIVPSLRSLPSETGAHLWIQKHTDTLSCISCHLCASALTGTLWGTGNIFYAVKWFSLRYWEME